MHFAITLVVVALLYLGLFHTRVNKWAALILPLVFAAIAHALAPGAQSGIGLVVEYLALFLVGSIGLATRTIDSVADDLDGWRPIRRRSAPTARRWPTTSPGSASNRRRNGGCTFPGSGGTRWR